jgi:hypothetical protein
MKKINLLCVLVLALTLVDIVMSLFFTSGKSATHIDFDTLSLGSLIGLLVLTLVILGAGVMTLVYFIKFILNINRNEVFTRKNISLLRWYAAATLMASVCLVLIGHYFPTVLDLGVEEIIEGVIEGAFALLIAEVFSIGMKLEEEKNAVA